MIELITTSFFVFSSIYGSSTAAIANNQAAVTPQSPVATIEATTSTNIPTNEGIEAEAKDYFKDTPILADIAFCESSFRQYDNNGNVLEGEIDKDDIGVMQINKHYQGEEAAQLGYDLNTPEGNMSYAKYLYETEGTKPWESSEKCWKGDLDSIAGNEVALN